MADEQVHVVFTLDGQEYGVPIAAVQEIDVYTPPTRLPATPAYVEGVISLRGTVMPVVDLRRRLGLAPAAPGPDTRIMVLKLDGWTGVVVDGVTEVLKVRAADVEPPDQVSHRVSAHYLLGLVRTAGRLVPLVDMAKVLAPDPGHNREGRGIS